MVFGYGGQIPPKERFVHHFPPIHGRLTVNGAVRVTPGKIQKGHIPNTPWDWHIYILVGVVLGVNVWSICQFHLSCLGIGSPTRTLSHGHLTSAVLH